MKSDPNIRATLNQSTLLRLTAVAVGAVAVIAFFVAGNFADGATQQSQVQESNIVNLSDTKARFVPDGLFAVDVLEDGKAWVAGYYGTLLRTDDGGATWTHHSLPFTDLIRRVDFVDEHNGWAVTSRGKIIRTSNGGEDWSVAHEMPGVFLRDVHFASRSLGWAVGHESTILHTSDGGQSWQEQRLLNYSGRDIPRINGIASHDSENLILVGEFGLIAETNNGGETWTVITPEGLNSTFTDVDTGAGRAIAVGIGGSIAQIDCSADCRRHEQESPASERVTHRNTTPASHLLAIDLVQDGSGFAVGQGVAFRVSSDGSFSPMPLPDQMSDFSWLGGVAAELDSESLIAVGMGGNVFKINLANNSSARLLVW